MADFQGKFQYAAPGGGTGQEGPCQVEFDEQSFTLTPATGTPLAFDLGDLDAVIADDYEVRLPLYTGSTVVLRHLGKSYDDLARQLIESYRERTVQCLLLEDLEEVERFTGNFSNESGASGPAEFRLYKSNLAVLSNNSQSFQWRLADVDAITFDDKTYEVTLTSNEERLKISKLAKRTEEFRSKVEQCMAALAAQSTQALHGKFPFLNPEQLQSAARVLREGGCAPVARLDAIHPKFSAALSANAVDKNLKPYFDELLKLTAAGQLYAGFKLIRSEVEAESHAEDEPADKEASTDKTNADHAGPDALYWFYFPLASKSDSTEVENVVGWEASSASGRATYFFRLVDAAKAAEWRAPNVRDAAVRRLNRVLGMLNFRRRPIYLSNDELEMDARFRRYAIAARRMPEVREVRANFLGRAIHSSLETWQSQVADILAKASGH